MWWGTRASLSAGLLASLFVAVIQGGPHAMPPPAVLHEASPTLGPQTILGRLTEDLWSKIMRHGRLSLTAYRELRDTVQDDPELALILGRRELERKLQLADELAAVCPLPVFKALFPEQFFRVPGQQGRVLELRFGESDPYLSAVDEATRFPWARKRYPLPSQAKLTRPCLKALAAAFDEPPEDNPLSDIAILQLRVVLAQALPPPPEVFEDESFYDLLDKIVGGKRERTLLHIDVDAIFLDWASLLPSLSSISIRFPCSTSMDHDMLLLMQMFWNSFLEEHSATLQDLTVSCPSQRFHREFIGSGKLTRLERLVIVDALHCFANGIRVGLPPLTSLPALRHFESLHEFQYDAMDTDTFAQLAQIPHLETLVIEQFVDLGDIPTADLTALLSRPGLRTFHVNFVGEAQDPVAVFAALRAETFRPASFAPFFPVVPGQPCLTKPTVRTVMVDWTTFKRGPCPFAFPAADRLVLRDFRRVCLGDFGRSLLGVAPWARSCEAALAGVTTVELALDGFTVAGGHVPLRLALLKLDAVVHMAASGGWPRLRALVLRDARPVPDVRRLFDCATALAVSEDIQTINGLPKAEFLRTIGETRQDPPSADISA